MGGYGGIGDLNGMRPVVCHGIKNYNTSNDLVLLGCRKQAAVFCEIPQPLAD